MNNTCIFIIEKEGVCYFWCLAKFIIALCIDSDIARDVAYDRIRKMRCSHKRARDGNGNADDASTGEEDSDIISLDEMPQEPNEEAHMDSTPSGSTASRADYASSSFTSNLHRRSESGRMRSQSEQSGETQGEVVNSATDVSTLSSPSASTEVSASTTSSRPCISPTNNFVQNQWSRILRSFY